MTDSAYFVKSTPLKAFSVACNTLGKCDPCRCA